MKDEREFEHLLRQALHDHAAQIQPAGDGLSRIRARVGRRRYLTWLRPALATVAAAAAAVAIIAVPSMFDSHAGDRHSAASSAADRASRPAQHSPTAPTTPRITPLQQEPVTAWPYGTLADARQHAATLTDPRAVATDLVRAFAGSGYQGQLTLTTRLVRSDDKAKVEIRRADSGQDVCTVDFTRIGGKAYVVTQATSPDVRIGPVPDLRGSANPVDLSGTVSPVKGVTGIVRLDVRAPGQHRAGSANQDYFDTSGARDQVWNKIVNPNPVWPQHAVIAAWTVDRNGLVLSFSAEPIGSASSLPSAAATPHR